MAGKSENSAEIASNLHKQAMLQEDEENYDQAIKLYEESLQINQELGNKAGAAYTLGQLGNVHCKLGDYTQAQSAYEECLEISRDINDKGSIAKALHQLAILQEEQGEYTKALSLYQKSLEIEKELGDKAGIAESLAQMGRLAEHQDDLLKAAGFYAVAQSIFQKIKSPYVILVSTWLSKIQLRLPKTELEVAVAASMQEYKDYL